VGAYGPQQEAIVLRRYALAYQPRYIVWQIFEGNDLNDAQRFIEWKQDPRPRSSFLERYLGESLLRSLLVNALDLRSLSRTRATLIHTGGTRERMYLLYARETAPAPRAFAAIETALHESRELCDRAGVRLLAVYIPTMVRVLDPYLVFDDPADRARFLPASLDGSEQDFGVRLEQACSRAGCDFIDTTAALQGAAAEDRRGLFLPDEHLDVRGHEVVAREIVVWLKAREGYPSE
jgi:hypothetical protein